MRRKTKIKIVVLLLAMLIAISLVGCGENTTLATPSEATPSASQSTTIPPTATAALSNPPSAPSAEVTSPPLSEIEPEESTSPVVVSPMVSLPPAVAPLEETDEFGLTEQQRNSFSMLYYLAITAEEIRISKDNRLLLDDIYTSLLNDINPGAIDETTQDHLQNLRDVIKSYINISVKRDRLQYIYNQDKASTIHNAVPNPLAVLSMTGSFDWKKLAASAVYTVVDSYNNYKSANGTVDQEFLLSGWELDDEETAAIQKNRERAFDYMVDIVQEYDLDGKLTLNEKAIENFAAICAIESVQQKIRRLESEEDTYKLLGNYWLELADCYYETSQYRKCLDCVEQYNKLASGIYRKDHNYVQILPKAIVAAQTIYSGDDYVSHIEAFADSIMENTATDEWSIRYFAAQAYLDLYARTDEREYLKTAYNIAYDNVAILLDEQRAMNATYMADVKELTVEEPDYRFMTDDEKEDAEKEYKAEQKRLKSYNNALKETRKTELPALYEPLILNCDLLFALADEMHISKAEQAEIEAILQTDKNGVFLVEPINHRYSFSTTEESYCADFSKDNVVIPVVLLSADAGIVVTVSDNGKTTTFDDCVVSKVEREGETIDTFYAEVSSETMKDYEWSADSKIEVKITNNDENSPVILRFKVAEYKDRWLIGDKVVFEEA